MNLFIHVMVSVREVCDSLVLDKNLPKQYSNATSKRNNHQLGSATDLSNNAQFVKVGIGSLINCLIIDIQS